MKCEWDGLKLDFHLTIHIMQKMTFTIFSGYWFINRRGSKTRSNTVESDKVI